MGLIQTYESGMFEKVSIIKEEDDLEKKGG